MNKNTNIDHEIHSLQTKLGIYEAKIQDLEKKIRRQKPESEKRAENVVEDLNLKRKKLVTQMLLAKEKGASAFGELKDGLDKAWEDLKSSVDQAASRF